VQDAPEVLHTFQMVQAKLAGFIAGEGCADPLSEKRHQRNRRACHAMVYMRQPNFTKALAAVNRPGRGRANNPISKRRAGQIFMSWPKPGLAIADYQKSVDLRPRAPQLRWRWPPPAGHRNPALAAPALQNLKPRPWRRTTMSSPGTRPPGLQHLEERTDGQSGHR